MKLYLFLVLVSTGVLVEGFYLPVQSRTIFCSGWVQQDNHTQCETDVYVHVNKLDSLVTLVPYEYSSFDFCDVQHSSNTDRDPVESLGQVLSGERLRASAYNITFKKDEFNKKLCEKHYHYGESSDRKHLQFLVDRINENYQHSWVIDNMPVMWCYVILESEKPFCTTSFPLGCYVTEEGVRRDACYLSEDLNEKGTTYIFNHVDITLFYHDMGGPRLTIVRAQIQLRSCDSFPCMDKSKPKTLPNPNRIPKDFSIVYSYSVEFQRRDQIRWASRWEYILSSAPQGKVQWFSLFNTVLITVFLLTVVTMVLIGHQRRGMSRNWNLYIILVRGGIFHPPSLPVLLAVFVGSGAQIFFTTVLTLLFACVGLLSPPNRGALATAVLVFYILMGAIAGYLSARLYKMLGGLWWKLNVITTGLFVPGVVYVVFVVINLFLRGAGSSAAVPFTTLLVLLGLWFGISLPLTIFGGFFGFWKPTATFFGFRLKPTTEQVVHADLIPDGILIHHERQQRMCSCCCSIFSVFIGGILPFGTVFIQLFFIFNSIWAGQMYYMPGFISLAFLSLVAVCALTSIILCHFQLRSENSHWWWRSFLSSGSFTFYFFLFCVHYFFNKTSFTGWLSYLLYFSYCFILSFLFFILTGTIGFVACLIFVRKMHTISQNKLADSDLNT